MIPTALHGNYDGIDYAFNQPQRRDELEMPAAGTCSAETKQEKDGVLFSDELTREMNNLKTTSVLILHADCD